MSSLFSLYHLLTHHPNILCFIIFMTSFHFFSLLFHIIDTSIPQARPFKHFRAPPNAPSYPQMLPRVLFNQFFILLPLMLLCTKFGLSYTLEQPVQHPPTPLASLLAMLALAPLLHEIPFYIFHRYVLHSSWGFRNLNHALHHSSLAHSAVSAMYMSAPDFLLEIVIPYLVPLIVLSKTNLCNTPTCIAILPLGAFGGLYEHSGYNFFEGIAALDTTVHGLHHRFYNCSFADGVGAPSILDTAMGTSCNAGPPAKVFRKWLGFKDLEQVKAFAAGSVLSDDTNNSTSSVGANIS